MELSATLRLDTGPFADALADALRAVESLAGEAGGLSAAVADAKARLDELAKSSEGAAGAQKNAADGANALADAQKSAAAETGKAADAAKGGADALDGAKTAMASAGAVGAAASGNIQGVASSFIGLGRAAQTSAIAMKALPWVAVAAVVAGLAMALKRARDTAAQARLDGAFEGAASAARSLADEVGRINAALDRTANLAKALRGVADAGAATRERIAAANLERDRQTALKGAKTDEERQEINDRFDRLRIEQDHASATASAGRRRAGLEAEKAGNDEKLAELREALAAAVADQTAANQERLRNAGEAARLRNEYGGAGAVVNRAGIGRAESEADRWGGISDELAKTISSLGDQIKALEDSNEVLGASLEEASKDAELADAERDAALARLEADIAARPAKEEKAEEEPKRAAGRAEPVASDRLARIGGFVGGNAPAMKTSEDLLRRANEQRGQLITAMSGLAANMSGRAPAVEAPRMPKVSVAAPDVEAPRMPPVSVAVPNIEVPKVSVAAPDVEVPRMPPVSVAAPAVEVPRVGGDAAPADGGARLDAKAQERLLRRIDEGIGRLNRTAERLGVARYA